MSRVYDSWEKLVGAVLEREELRQLAFCESFSTIATDSSSRFDSDSVLDEIPIEDAADDRSLIHFETNNFELLQVEPRQIQFPFKLKKPISCPLQLTNNSDNYVAFKIRATNASNYAVRPNPGTVMPHSICDVIVTMRNKVPLLMLCKDIFIIRCVVVDPSATEKDIVTPKTFNKESGKQVYDCKLTVAYVRPRLPSPAQEGSEEGCSPRASLSDNGTVNQSSDSNIVSKEFAEKDESRSEVEALISKLSEERDCAIEQNDKLLQELELLRG